MTTERSDPDAYTPYATNTTTPGGPMAGQGAGPTSADRPRSRAREDAVVGPAAPETKVPTRPDGVTLGARGNATRKRLLVAAEEVFLNHGYYEASVTKITAAAEVSQGTFYTYFNSKSEIFEELVMDLNRRLRHELTEASSTASSPLEIEQRGFEALVSFTERHPALFRVIRQSEFVAPATMRRHYEVMASGYQSRLTKSQERGEIFPYEPEVLTWLLMGMAEMFAMRWTVWEEQGDHDIALGPALEEVGRFLRRALAPE